jgi:hypothetical protein
MVRAVSPLVPFLWWALLVDYHAGVAPACLLLNVLLSLAVLQLTVYIIAHHRHVVNTFYEKSMKMLALTGVMRYN